MTKTVEIIVGSMLGASEYVADALADVLKQADIPHRLHLQPNLQDIDSSATWLLCSSTHGAGDLPDNIEGFAEALQQLSLTNQYMVVGLGDSSYDTFCGAAHTLDNIMQSRGAESLHAPLLIDVLEHPVPEEVAAEWLQQRISLLESS